MMTILVYEMMCLSDNLHINGYMGVFTNYNGNGMAS